MNHTTASCCAQPSSHAATANNPSAPSHPIQTRRMPVDVREDAQGVTLLADMPGVKREDLRLQVDADTLRIEGDVSAHGASGNRPATRYQRAFALSKQLDAQQVTAELHHGVLRVRIAKAASAQARRINVTVS
jgi:HSP20 family protein